MKVLNEFSTHHYVDEYLKSVLFCPNCGKQEVWAEGGAGDYYCGPDFICTYCGHYFTIQGPQVLTEPHQVKKLQQLRSGATLDPSTPQGQ